MTSRIAVYRLTVLLSVAFFLGSAPAAEEPLMVGMAVADITPPVQQMAGPLKARCVVFRQGNEQAAVVCARPKVVHRRRVRGAELLARPPAEESC